MKVLPRHIISCILLSLSCLCATAQLSASAILDKLKTNVAAAQSVEAIFTINGGDARVQGSIIMAGSKFTMATPDISVWYDGKTQWTLMQASKEVNISEPSVEELMVSNPFAIITAHDGYYNARRLPDVKNLYRIELTPKNNNSGIEKIILTLNTATLWPTSILVNFYDNQHIEVKIDRIAGGNTKNDAIFRFNEKRYPSFDIIDLR